MLSALCPRYTPMFLKCSAACRDRKPRKTRGFGGDSSPPKAEVTGSNPVGCTNLFKHIVAIVGAPYRCLSAVCPRYVRSGEARHG